MQVTESHEKPTTQTKVMENCKGSFFECLLFASEAHKSQLRKDVEKTPYINHPIGVAYIIAEEAEICNLDLIQAGLLHDTIEDTEVEFEDIKSRFGPNIADLVLEVTDDKSLLPKERKQLQIAHAKSTSPQGKIVKLADKLYNLRDLERSSPIGWTEQRVQEYFDWACKVCEGLQGVSPILEEKLYDIFKNKCSVPLYMPLKKSQIYDWPEHDHIKPFLRAVDFAAIKHSKYRKFNVPYINHVISTTLLVYKLAEVSEERPLVAALLLDVVGKTETSSEEISQYFGAEVANLTAELSYDHGGSAEDQMRSLFKKISHMSLPAKVIALAAVLDNCQRLSQLDNSSFCEEREANFHAANHFLTIRRNTNRKLEQELEDILKRTHS